MDVTAAEVETRSSRRIRQPVPALVAVLLATIVLAGLTLVLVQTSGWHGQGRPPAFEFLFLRDEPAAAWLSCLIILVAALAGSLARTWTDLVRDLHDRRRGVQFSPQEPGQVPELQQAIRLHRGEERVHHRTGSWPPG